MDTEPAHKKTTQLPLSYPNLYTSQQHWSSFGGHGALVFGLNSSALNSSLSPFHPTSSQPGQILHTSVKPSLPPAQTQRHQLHPHKSVSETISKPHSAYSWAVLSLADACLHHTPPTPLPPPPQTSCLYLSQRVALLGASVSGNCSLKPWKQRQTIPTIVNIEVLYFLNLSTSNSEHWPNDNIMFWSPHHVSDTMLNVKRYYW